MSSFEDIGRLSSNEDIGDGCMRDIAIGDWSNLGAIMRTRRLKLGLSQTEAAGRANVSRSWLARVEAGHRGAELEHTLRLLEALELTMVVRETPARAGDEQIAQEITARHRERAEIRQRAWSISSGDTENRA
jgi:transcriptional regulator with XRE-family HTH domain